MNGCKQCPAYAKCTVTYRGSACAALRSTYGIDTDPEIVSTTDREKLIELLKDATPIKHTHGELWVEVMAQWLIDNGVTVLEWHNAADDKPSDFVSVLGHMTDAGDFPAVRECYHTENGFYFPALMEIHPVDKWAYMPEDTANLNQEKEDAD